jgi:hypothetical protein
MAEDSSALAKVLAMLPGLNRNDLFAVVATAQSLALRGRNQAAPTRRVRETGSTSNPSSGPTPESKTGNKVKKKGSEKSKAIRKEQKENQDRNFLEPLYHEYIAKEKTFRARLKRESKSFKEVSNDYREPREPITNELDYRAHLASHFGETEVWPELESMLLSRWRWFRRKDQIKSESQSSGDQNTRNVSHAEVLGGNHSESPAGQVSLQASASKTQGASDDSKTN